MEINDLTITQNNDGSYTWSTPKPLPVCFDERWSDAELQHFIDDVIEVARQQCTYRGASREEHDALTKDQRRTRGLEMFDQLIRQSEPPGLTIFQRALFWASSWWWHTDTRMLARVFFPNKDEIGEAQASIADFIIPALPQSIQECVKDMVLVETASNPRHFALLFVSRDDNLRRIVTDTQLFELTGVMGYVYLDITHDGKPVARSCCERGGGRAFFDGVRLMSHPRFETCAPKTVMVDSGYKVNSTGCTIVNGMLFPLIDADDPVAHTHGAFFGFTAFDQNDVVRATEMAQASGTRMRVDGSRVTLDGTELKPTGVFYPSETTLLPTGFTHFGWSKFRPINYSKIA